MTYTPITQGTLNWDVPVNAAFVDQNARIDVNTVTGVANSAAITTLQAAKASAVKTADTSVTNSTTYMSDPHLLVPVVSGGIYMVEGYMAYNTPSAAGINLRMTGPTGTGLWTFFALNVVAGNADFGTIRTSTSPNGSGTARVGGAATDISTILRGTFNATASGNLQFEWTQNAANATPTTMRTNSWLSVTRVN